MGSHNSVALSPLAALAILGAVSVPASAFTPACDLTGDWVAERGDAGAVYRFVQAPGGDDSDSFTVTFEPATGAEGGPPVPNHWQRCNGTIEGVHVVLRTDTGHTLTGDAAGAPCSRIPWDSGPSWCRKGLPCAAVPTPAPTPSPAAAAVRTVHVTSMNHLDLGFTLPRDGGPPTAMNGQPRTAFP